MRRSLLSSTQLSGDHLNEMKHRDNLRQEGIELQEAPLNLVVKLCESLAAENISYCHWKSNNALDRSASGRNDLDLLVSREDISRFGEILYHLGFKQALGTAGKLIVGVTDYYGYDELADKVVHIHAHYQLVLGHDMTKNFRLPIEEAYLGSATQSHIFRVPAPEFEFIVLVIRMMLKHLTWDAILGGQGKLKATEQRELEYLQAKISHDRVMDILKRYLPYIDIKLFNQCIQALQPASSTWFRVRAGQKLQSMLRESVRRPLFIDVGMKLWRRITLATHWRFFKSSPKRHLEGGGIMIAMVGGDGAGKSTAVDAACNWLSKNFATIKVHMGIPVWSWLTIAVRGILKIGQVIGLYPVESSIRETLQQESFISPGFPWLLREVCRARDRYLTYVKAQRFAANGGIVIFDRFPMPQIRLMDAPHTEQFISQLCDGPYSRQFMSPRQTSPLVKTLIKLEQRYYARIVLPEMLIVLRVNPEIAVQRKTNENPLDVRIRSQEVWDMDWDRTSAYVIDASRPKDEMISELKSLIWSKL